MPPGDLVHVKRTATSRALPALPLALATIVLLCGGAVARADPDDTAARVLATVQHARGAATAPILVRRDDLDAVARSRAERIAAQPHAERLRSSHPLADDLRHAGVVWYRQVAAHFEMVRGYERPEDGLVASWRGVTSAWEKAIAADYDAIGVATRRTADGWIVFVAVLLDEIPAPPRPGAIETAILGRVNRERETRGLPALDPSEPLADVARAHSLDMATRGYLSHVDPDGRGPADRVERAGIAYLRVAENIYFSRGEPGDPDEATVRSWLASPGHRHVMLDESVTRAGVGVVLGADGAIHVTQLFLRPQ